MKKVKFLKDFQGRETNERFFLKDTEVELEDHMADLLVKEKRAEFVFDPELTQRIPHANPANEPQFEEVPPLQEETEVDALEVPELPKKRGRR